MNAVVIEVLTVMFHCESAEWRAHDHDVGFTVFRSKNSFLHDGLMVARINPVMDFRHNFHMYKKLHDDNA